MKVKSGWTQDILLLSDLHWDNPHCKRDVLKQDLDEAVRRNAPIMLFGDTFCAMQGRFDRRSSKDDIREEHQNGNYLDSLVDTAADWFEPYAKNLTIISDGNHETAITKHHETDLVERLVSKLRDRGAVSCRHGGYSGWVKLSTKHEAGGKYKSLRLFYHHGSGGGSPVTKGSIGFNRMMETAVGADIYVSGHIHRQNVNKQIVAKLNEANKVEHSKVYYVRTSTYKEEYGSGTGGWHVERGMGPRPIGGYWLRLSYKNCDIRYTIAETEGE